jgi:methyl-accepting chemotaxis protein
MRLTITVRAKLLILVGVPCLALALSAGVSVVALGRLAGAGDLIYQQGVVRLGTVSEVAIAIEAQSGRVRRAPSEMNYEAALRHKAAFARHSAEIDRGLTALETSGLDARRQDLLKELRRASTAFRDQAQKVFDLGLKYAQDDAVQAIQTGFLPAEQAVERAVDRLVTDTREAAGAELTRMQETARRTRNTLLVWVGLLSVAVGGISLALARSISRPLRRMVAMLQDIAQGDGDLTRRLDATHRDEVGEVARGFNTFVDRLEAIMRGVRASASQVSTAARQVAAAAGQLASGAQRQAASLEETSASLEQLALTVKQNADSAGQASRLAAGSQQTAEHGGQVVVAAVQSMGEVTRSSRRIGDIVAAIDDIAFQTNLLALNAAVEAARAGEQGRGFAVVAAEVRSLAQRSAGAAKEIKTLAHDSIEKVEAGSTHVNRSGQTLEGIIGSVQRVASIVADIAAASRDQAAGIDDVNSAVVQMDRVVQANSAQTEELSSTAEMLEEEASQLAALVGQFKVRDGETPAEIPLDPPIPRHVPLAPERYATGALARN